MQLNGCKITGKWTESHQDIAGNEQADRLAKLGTKKDTGKWARTTIVWLRHRPYHNMISKWHRLSPARRPPQTRPFTPTRNMFRRSANTISRLRAGLTGAVPTPLRAMEQCPCNMKVQWFVKDIMMDCTLPLNLEAKNRLLANHKGPN